MKSQTILPLLAAAILPMALGFYTPLLERELAARNVKGGSCTIKKDPPAKAICGEYGRIVNPPGDPPTKAADLQKVSFATCRDWCFNRNSPIGAPSCCASFSHAGPDKLGTCNLYGDILTTANFEKNSSSSAKFYSYGCYQCDRSCPLPHTVTNLLDNPGFEVSNKLLGPWLSGSVTPPERNLVTSPGYHSENAFHGPGLSQCVATCNAQTYLMGADVRSSHNTNFRMSVGDCEVLLPLVGSKNNSSNAWRKPRCSTVTSFEYSIGLFDNILYTDFDKPGFLDNVFLKPITPSESAATVGESLLENGGFETGKRKPWVVTLDVEESNTTSKVVSGGLGPNGGKYHYFAKGTSAKEGFHVRDTSVTFSQQTIKATDPDKLYVVSFTYRINHHRFPDLFVTVGNYGWTPKLQSGKATNFSRIFTGSGKIDNFSLYFDASTDYGTNKPFVQTVELDNVSIYELRDQ